MTDWPIDKRGCARGLLDNLNHECEAVIDWQCDYCHQNTCGGDVDQNPSSLARAEFWVLNIKRRNNGCIERAIKTASPNQSVSIECGAQLPSFFYAA